MNKNKLIETYHRIVKGILDADLTDQEKVALIMMLSAQIPNAISISRVIYNEMNIYCLKIKGDRLLTVGLMCPITGNRVKSTSTNMFEDGDDKPVVRLTPRDDPPRSFDMSPGDAATMCKFHMIEPPSEKDIKEKGIITIRIIYNHVSGCAYVYHTNNEPPVLQLTGDFSLDSFLPVKIELI